MQRPPSILRRPTLGRLACLGLAISLAWAAPSKGDDLGREMTVVAQQVKLLLKQRGMDAVAVGEFRGPARLASSSGPAIAKALGDSLTQSGVTVKRNADLEINGDYRDVEDGKSKQIAVQIKARVVDKSGAEVVAFEPRGVFNVGLIAALTGVTVTLPPDGTDEQRSKAVADGIDDPKVHLDGTRISAAPGSPYAIEILVKDRGNSVPRVPTKEEGFAFHKIRRDEIYEVRLINDSPHDAAVTLTIDGLSVFAFSQNKAYTHWIVASKGKLVVPGWHVTNTHADSFLVTEYAKSAVADALPTSSGVGTITATFAAAWPKGGTPPADEASFKKGSRSGDATGKGPPVKTGFVDVIRETGVVRSSVSVRYTKDDSAKKP